MLLSNLEYIPLRLARRFLVRPSWLDGRLARALPYYRHSQNQIDAKPLIARYVENLERLGIPLGGSRILEVGVGVTNSTGYELAATLLSSPSNSPTEITLFEPLAPYLAEQDIAHRRVISASHGIPEEKLATAVQRVESLDAVAPASMDIILSHSVLEHVEDLRALFDALKRVLRPGGAMLHIVDYRDHFFKYPYHFLQFSPGVWNRLLNPGDLPRWRVGDHLRLLRQMGWQVKMVESQTEAEKFEQIRLHLAPEFDANDENMSITRATLFVFDETSPTAGRPST